MSIEDTSSFDVPADTEMNITSEEIESRPYPSTSNAKDLLNKVFPPVRWAVPDILPEGVTLLAGKAKLGKSWLALGLCHAITSGGCALGKKRVEQGDTLYLALEDNEKRLQKRLKTILNGEDMPEGFFYSTAWPNADEGGAEALDEWLEDHPSCRLVVIDTLKKFRPRRGNNKNAYDVDYEALEPLLPIAAKHTVSMMVIHHLRKMDADDPLDLISGSTGLTGGADGVLILRRERGSSNAVLYVDGRDIEEQGELALSWDHVLASWTLEGPADVFRMSDERQVIFDALPEFEEVGIGPKEISNKTGMKYENVRQLLKSMVDAGQASSSRRGKYSKSQSHQSHQSQLDFVISDDEPNHHLGAEKGVTERNVTVVTDVIGDTKKELVGSFVSKLNKIVEQGEKELKLYSKHKEEIEKYLANPPMEFFELAENCKDINPLATKLADELLNDPYKWKLVKPFVANWCQYLEVFSDKQEGGIAA